MLSLYNQLGCAIALRHACIALAGALLVIDAHANTNLKLTVKGRGDSAISALTDGNAIRLHVALPRPAAQKTIVVFHLDTVPEAIGQCAIPRGATACETAELGTLGWFWATGAKAQPQRMLTAMSIPGKLRSAVTLRVDPRPVVLVHGFMASDKSWRAYTAPDGFLAPLGLGAFAVGDGRAEGALDEGDFARPTSPTKSLAENAVMLGRYIAGVKKLANAEMVDLVAHSMGGLIARYYIARLMAVRDVAQLLMLGVPHGGSDCSGLLATLGIYTPAALELRPAYLRQIFNPSVTRRQGVPFYMLAGDPILDGFKAPCSGVPSDIVVGLDSVGAIPGVVQTLPVLHMDMTKSEFVFRHFVLPHLQREAGAFPSAADPEVAAEVTVPTQYTHVFAGRVEAGGTKEVAVHLDQVAVASFALFDPTRSLDVSVRGASGKVIALTPQDHGLIKIEDPTALLYLGYGFKNPKPGAWKITLIASPRIGADFVLSARVVGGAVLRARANQTSPALGQAVTLSAALELAGKPLTDVSIAAVIHQPNGKSDKLELRQGDGESSVEWRPAQIGIHGIDVIARAQSDGLPIERTTFLAVEVRP